MNKYDWRLRLIDEAVKKNFAIAKTRFPDYMANMEFGKPDDVEWNKDEKYHGAAEDSPFAPIIMIVGLCKKYQVSRYAAEQYFGLASIYKKQGVNDMYDTYERYFEVITQLNSKIQKEIESSLNEEIETQFRGIYKINNRRFLDKLRMCENYIKMENGSWWNQHKPKDTPVPKLKLGEVTFNGKKWDD